MAYEIPGFMLGTLEANVDMSTESMWQFVPVDVAAATGAGLFGPAAAIGVVGSGDPAIGVLQNNPQLAEAATIMVSGVTKCVAQGTIAIGDKLAAVPQGGVITAQSGMYIIGRALESAVVGNIFSVLLQRNGKL